MSSSDPRERSPIPYELRRSERARTLRIAVYPDGEVVVTAPARASLSSIERFAKKYTAWVHKARERSKSHQTIRLVRSDIVRLKKEALNFAEDRCRYYAARYGFTYAKITIRAQKSRWGSCSRRGNLSFNYKIAALPREIAEYVIVHEICHRGAFDHSKKFWELVEREVLNHRELRHALREIAFRFE